MNKGTKDRRLVMRNTLFQAENVVIVPFGNVNGGFYCTGQPWFWDSRTTGTEGGKWREGEAQLKPYV